MEKMITILGSTGSVGTQTLEIVRANPDLKVCALAAKKSIQLLAQQIREFHPKLAVVWKEQDALMLEKMTKGLDVTIACGMDGLIEAARFPDAQILMNALVGMIGIRPTIEAIKAGKDLALANKETMVTAGHLIIPLAKKMAVRILPVDSEHSAIFHCLQAHAQEEQPGVEKILLTASGGPFRGMSPQQLAKVKVEDALKHPNWNMGQKITIDSASLVNKGLEVMEARWLFDVPPEKIHVLVQPQSVIHSMVQFEDGAVIAQLATPDIKLPIQYALFYPERRHLGGERLDFAALGQLLFEEPDWDTFRGLRMGYIAAHEGGSVPTVYNAANEIAVEKFLSRKIQFTQIYDIIEYCMRMHNRLEDPDVEQILETQQEVCEMVESRW